MATRLTIKFKDKSLRTIVVAFTDDDDIAVTPTTITWTLTDISGSIINSRENVNVATPAAEIDVVLEGADVDYDDGEERVLTLKVVGNVNAGNSKTWYDEVRFQIEDLLNVS